MPNQPSTALTGPYAGLKRNTKASVAATGGASDGR